MHLRSDQQTVQCVTCPTLKSNSWHFGEPDEGVLSARDAQGLRGVWNA